VHFHDIELIDIDVEVERKLGCLLG